MKIKTVKCKLFNRWYWSVEQAGLLIESPQGGHVWIKKSAINNPEVYIAANDLLRTIGNSGNADSIELTVDEMQLLLNVAKFAKGCFYKTKQMTESIYTY